MGDFGDNLVRDVDDVVGEDDGHEHANDIGDGLGGDHRDFC